MAASGMRASENKRREVTPPETYGRKAWAETSNVAYPTLPYIGPTYRENSQG